MAELTAELTKQCREYFQDVDTNGDGELSPTEFVGMLRFVGIELEEKQLLRVFNTCDKDGSGTITLNEFINTYAKSGLFATNDGESVKPPVTKRRSGKPGKSGKSGKSVRRNITEADITEGCKYFWKCDKDFDGRLNSTEFGSLLLMIGMSLKERDVSKAFSVGDADGDGFVSFADYTTTYINQIKANAMTKEKISLIYIKCDYNAKGYLTKLEFRETMRMLGNELEESDLKKLLTAASKEDCESVSKAEFFSFLGISLESDGQKTRKASKK